MVALVESWDTFLVQRPATASVERSGDKNRWTGVRDNACVTRPSAYLPSRTFLSDACPPLSVLEDGEGQQSTSSYTSLTDTPPSLLWLLTLVSRNVELLRAAAHLVLQFNAQFATLLDANKRAVNDLRERHQQQLASLLEVADRRTTSDMIVDSTVTERVVHQQEGELDRLELECEAAERQLELQLQDTLFTFLNTSAPDAVAAANWKEETLSWVAVSNNGGDGGHGSGADGLYRAEVDVSRFAEVCRPAPRNPHQSRSAVAPFSPVHLVPVRTIKLNNEVGNVSTNATNNTPTRKRANDVTLQPIILDVSPLSGLTQCLTCCSGTHPGAVASSVASAAEEHLLRLAHTRHSVLLLIGSEAAALEVVATCRAPELLLGAAHSCRDRFTPLPHHPVLRVLFTTRMWGANVVLLWNPSQEMRPSARGFSPATAAHTVVEDALELAYAWDADMFSVAVLEGARLPPYPPHGQGSTPVGTTSAFFAAQAMSMEVLRQLRNGVTRELLETAGARRARCWHGSSAWLQLGGGAVTTAGAHMCPRAVGVLYASQAAPAVAAAAAGEEAQKRAGTASVSAVLSPTFTTPSSPTSASRGPPVTFNTPLAIRAFLPLPEEYFIKEPPDRRGTDSRDSHGGSLGGGSSGVEGRGNNSARGRLGRGGTAAAPAGVSTSALDDGLSDEADLSHGSFTSVTLSRSARGDGGDPQSSGSSGNVSYGSAALLRERQPEAMGLEALIHYAFGEFAETL
jgi:hypothetical protein